MATPAVGTMCRHFIFGVVHTHPSFLDTLPSREGLRTRWIAVGDRICRKTIVLVHPLRRKCWQTATVKTSSNEGIVQPSWLEIPCREQRPVPCRYRCHDSRPVESIPPRWL